MADNNIITVTGMVISTMPVGETDRRIVLLTKERGKITAFAKGAKKPNSPLSASCQPFVFGEFEVYEGRTSYNIRNVNVKNYFRELVTDFYGAYYGFYFLELADYYGREGIEAKETLELLYFSMKELSKNVIPKALIRCIYELKTLVINGEYPNVFQCAGCGKNEQLEYFDIKSNVMFCKKCHGKVNNRYILNPSSVYTLQYIITSPINKLYTFTVKEEVLNQIVVVIEQYLKTKVDKKFNSLDFL